MTAQPSDWQKNTIRHGDIDFDAFKFELSTDRYISRDYADSERERVWMKTWQIVGRADELPQATAAQ